MKPYKHLTREERYSIEQMRKAGYKQNKIAELLERSEGTISRELNRNTGQRGYRHKQAHELADQRRFESRKRKEFTVEVQEAVEYYLREDYSPEQVTGYMRRQGETTVSHERIYQHIYSDYDHGGTLHLHLRRQRKKRRRRLGHKDRRGVIPNRVSIDERPAGQCGLEALLRGLGRRLDRRCQARRGGVDVGRTQDQALPDVSIRRQAQRRSDDCDDSRVAALRGEVAQYHTGQWQRVLRPRNSQRGFGRADLLRAPVFVMGAWTQ